MTIASILQTIDGSSVASWMKESETAFPWVESFHVIAIVLVVGTIAIVDLRLINVASRRYAVTEMTRDVLPWTWIGFALAVVTGALLFTSNPEKYFYNIYFQLKMLTLLLAGVNMGVFELFIARSVGKWNVDSAVPTGAKIAGSLSLLFWVSVVVFGRWIGFTMNGNF